MKKLYINPRSYFSKIKQSLRSKILSDIIKNIFSKNDSLINNGISILEFGPGYGDLASSLTSNLNVNKYYFIDHSQENLDYIKMNLDFNSSHFFCHDANESVSNVINESFDLVISSHVIEHLNQPKFHISDIKNLLKEKRYGLISTPNLDSVNAIQKGKSWRGFKDETHISLISYDKLKSYILEQNMHEILTGTSPNSLMEIIYQKKLNAIFFSKFKLGDSSNIIFKK